jgi:hypothetical protein
VTARWLALACAGSLASFGSFGLAACSGSTHADGNGSATPGSAAPLPPSPAVAVELPSRPLGLAELDGYRWRARGGQAAFRIARKAEQRDDWSAVASACTKALALDPSNLEAAWLLAAADGALGKQTELVAPLQLAVAGDFGKWADASLELPALQAWHATPTGQAWRRRVDADRAGYAAALARSVVVVAGGDLFGYDLGGNPPRWYRLTRTYGGVVAALALPETHRLAYVTRARRGARFGVGIVDLATGHATRPADVGTGWPIVVEPRTAGGVWLRGVMARTAIGFVGEDGKLAAATPNAEHPAVASLRVVGTSARLDRRAAEITADFDDHGLASQIRLDSSKRVVSVPSPGQIDGSSIAWSPDRVRVALIAQLEDRCSEGARAAVAVFVVDAATGVMKSVERATGGLALEWLTDGRLAVAGDHGVSVYDLEHPGAAPIAIPGATDLVTPRRVPRCLRDETIEPASAGSGGSATDDVELE